MTPTLKNESSGRPPISGRQLAAVGATSGTVPAIFLRSESGSRRFWEFFTVNIRNRNTQGVLHRHLAVFELVRESEAHPGESGPDARRRLYRVANARLFQAHRQQHLALAERLD